MNKQPLYMLFIIFHALSSLRLHSCNLLHYEMNYFDKHKATTYNTSFIIQHEIQQFYNFNTTIPLYVSVHNCNNKNYLQFINTTNEYNTHYHKLLGRTERFFQNSNTKTTLPIHEVIPAHTRTNLSLNDDILLRQISFTSNNNNTLSIFIMKNQFVSQYEQIHLNSHSLKISLQFYDLNIFYNCEAVVDGEHSNAVIVDKNEHGIVMDDIDDVNQQDELFISKYLSLNDYNAIISHNNIKHKVNALSTIASVMNVIQSSNESKINLQNYLLTSQLSYIKQQLLLIQKTLIPLYYMHYNTSTFNLKINELQLYVNTLMTYIQQFNFTKSDFGVDMWYYILTFILISLAVYILYLTLNEFKIAFQRKIA